MLRHVICEGDTPASLSARYRVPFCAIMRANRVHSSAWLNPGREIRIPDADFCRRDGFICLCSGVNILAEEARKCAFVRMSGEDTVVSIARKYRLPVRMVYVACGRTGGKIPVGTEFFLPLPATNARIYTAKPMDVLHDIAAAFACTEDEIRRENCLWGPLLPGMQILISERE